MRGRSRGLRFPGTIDLPSPQGRDSAGKNEKKTRNERVVAEALRWSEDPQTLWTDGSSLPSGATAAAVVGYLSPGEEGVGNRRFQALVERRSPFPDLERREAR